MIQNTYCPSGSSMYEYIAGAIIIAGGMKAVMIPCIVCT